MKQEKLLALKFSVLPVMEPQKKMTLTHSRDLDRLHLAPRPSPLAPHSPHPPHKPLQFDMLMAIKAN